MSDRRPTRDETLMRVAAVFSSRGTCNRAKVGAVIAIDGRIISTGYVGAPSGLEHCTIVGDELGPDGGCIRTVHAEANALAWAARNGTSTDGAAIYCTHEPCLKCAQLIVNAGIEQVFYEQPYRNHDGLELFDTLGIEVTKMSGYEQAITEQLAIDNDADENYKRVN